MGAFDSFIDFFSLIFSKNGAEARERRALRSVRASLKGVKPPVYKASGNLVLPGFASSVFELASALRPIRELLDRSVSSADVRVARLYRDFLVERRLPDDLRATIQTFSYETLRERLSADSGADAVISDADLVFRTAVKALDDRSLRSIDVESAEFDRLVDLCRYDFHRILTAFDKSADFEAASYKPKFSPVNVATVMGELEDLYSVLVDFRIAPDLVSRLFDIVERLNVEDAGELGKRVSKAAAAVNKALGFALSGGTLLALQRISRAQSAFMPPPEDAPPSALGAYKDRLSRRWAEVKERIFREERENSVAAETVELFGLPPEGGTVPVVAYDEELNRRLRTEQSRSLVWEPPLRLLKTFERRVLSQGYLDAAKKLAAEGFCTNEVFRARLVESVGKLEKCGTRIAAFEEFAGGRTRMSAVALRVALDEGLKGKDVSENVERIASALDERAKELVERDVRSLRELAEIVFDTIADFRRQTPELITNIRTLAVSGDKALIPTLARAYNDSARFLKLMKAFIVIAPGASAVEKPEVIDRY